MSIKRSTSAIKRSLYSGSFTLREGEADFFYLLTINGKGSMLPCLYFAHTLTLALRKWSHTPWKTSNRLAYFQGMWFINVHTRTHTDTWARLSTVCVHCLLKTLPMASLVPRPHFLCVPAGKKGELPIPFSFKCAGMLAHCSFLI